METSKWLEHHFGSESTRSSRDSALDIDEDPIKSQTAGAGVVNGTVIRNGW